MKYNCDKSTANYLKIEPNYFDAFATIGQLRLIRLILLLSHLSINQTKPPRYRRSEFKVREYKAKSKSVSEPLSDLEPKFDEYLQFKHLVLNSYLLNNY